MLHLCLVCALAGGEVVLGYIAQYSRREVWSPCRMEQGMPSYGRKSVAEINVGPARSMCLAYDM